MTPSGTVGSVQRLDRGLRNRVVGVWLGSQLNPLISSQLLHPRFAVQMADSMSSTLNMSDLPRLTLSQTKKDLMTCLNLSPSIML